MTLNGWFLGLLSKRLRGRLGNVRLRGGRSHAHFVTTRAAPTAINFHPVFNSRRVVNHRPNGGGIRWLFRECLTPSRDAQRHHRKQSSVVQLRFHDRIFRATKWTSAGRWSQKSVRIHQRISRAHHPAKNLTILTITSSTTDGENI